VVKLTTAIRNKLKPRLQAMVSPKVRVVRNNLREIANCATYPGTKSDINNKTISKNNPRNDKLNGDNTDETPTTENLSATSNEAPPITKIKIIALMWGTFLIPIICLPSL
jgi:hypothetical protein